MSRLAIFVAAACLAGTQAAQAGAATRYRCTMVDGTSRVLAQDLSSLFGRHVARCQPFDVTAATAQRPPPPPAPGDAFDNGAGDEWSTLSSATRTAPVVPPSGYDALIREASQRQSLDPELVAALIHVESRHQAHARSPKGALGLMQIMPATGARYGVSPARRLLDPSVNVDVGTRYLRDLHDLFDGSTELVLAAYNAGEGAVAKYGNRIPPYPETRAYVRAIMDMLRDPARRGR